MDVEIRMLVADVIEQDHGHAFPEVTGNSLFCQLSRSLQRAVRIGVESLGDGVTHRMFFLAGLIGVIDSTRVCTDHSALRYQFLSARAPGVC